MKLDIAFVALLIMLGVYSKPTKPYPPVWEYKHQYELFEKIYTQTQTIQQKLNSFFMTPKTCPNSWIAILDSCYFLPLHWTRNWLGAEEVCERLGGYLAILNTEEEDINVSAYLKNISTSELEHIDPVYIWIGGFDFVMEGVWKWVNGERFNYSNWRVPLGDSSVELRRQENCLDWSDGWNDNVCSRKYHFLCEKDKI